MARAAPVITELYCLANSIWLETAGGGVVGESARRRKVGSTARTGAGSAGVEGAALLSDGLLPPADHYGIDQSWVKAA